MMQQLWTELGPVRMRRRKYESSFVATLFSSRISFAYPPTDCRHTRVCDRGGRVFIRNRIQSLSAGVGRPKEAKRDKADGRGKS